MIERSTRLTQTCSQTISSARLFLLAMAMHPDVQRKAQAELDAVVGSHRLPCYADRSSLPYVDAIVKELARWQPVVPLVTHVSSADDEYKGYFIPKGSLVVGNSWCANSRVLNVPFTISIAVENLPGQFYRILRCLCKIQLPLLEQLSRLQCHRCYLQIHVVKLNFSCSIADFPSG